jgi:hypothetical protein
MSTVLADILAPGGAIARRMGERFEFRPEQLEMAAAVDDALKNEHHLLVEAGTGVGKSFAYLLPAIDFAVQNKKRVVISTHTISLQEQLINKDIPLIQSVYPDEFAAVLVKGRNNYLCQRRLNQTIQRVNSLFEFDRQRDSLADVFEWSRKTADGSLSDLPVLPENDVWGPRVRRGRQLHGQEMRVLREVLLAGGQTPHAQRPNPHRQSRPVLLRPRAADGRRQLSAEIRCGDSG